MIRQTISVGTFVFHRHVTGHYRHVAYVNWVIGASFWLEITLERDATRRRVQCAIELRYARTRSKVTATSHGHSNYSALSRTWNLLPQLKPLWGTTGAGS